MKITCKVTCSEKLCSRIFYGHKLRFYFFSPKHTSDFQATIKCCSNNLYQPIVIIFTMGKNANVNVVFLNELSVYLDVGSDLTGNVDDATFCVK